MTENVIVSFADMIDLVFGRGLKQPPPHFRYTGEFGKPWIDIYEDGKWRRERVLPIPLSTEVNDD